MIDECNKYYTKQEVDEYGIIVFTIEYIHKELKNSKVLIDTNVFIQRESYNNVSIEVVNTYNWFDKLNMKKYLHPITKDELLKYQNKTISQNMSTKMCAYEELTPRADSDDYFVSVTSKLSNNENDKIDDLLLLQVYNNNVDFLITNDKKMLEKARELYISEYVLSSQDFLRKVENKYPSLIDYDVLSVNLAKIGSLNFDDPFFDSLKEDYDEVKFTSWLNKKSSENAYVFKEKDKIQGFLYLKTEEYYDEDYTNIFPTFDNKKRLKIGTFKISKAGLRLGERFLKIIFDNAIKRNVDEIYVTMFEGKREEVEALKHLMNKWGFDKYGVKRSDIGEEIVLVKNMKFYNQNKDSMYNYPLLKSNLSKFGFLPILPEYHTPLFPDLYLKNEDMSLYIDSPCSYALEKIYVCNSRSTELTRGDLMLIYRMGDRQPKMFSSVISGIAIFEEMIIPNNKEEYLKICRNKTVFTVDELNDFYDNKKYRTIIKVIFFKEFTKKIILKNLWDNNIVSAPNGPRMSTIIGKDKFELICNLDKEK